MRAQLSPKRLTLSLGCVISRLSSRWTPSSFALGGYMRPERFSFGLMILSLASVVSTPSSSAQTRELTFSVSEHGGACSSPVTLYYGERLTMKFPRAISVSVPSHDHVIKIFSSGRLAVISAPNAPRRARARHADQASVDQVSVTTELEGGHTFLCRFHLRSPRDTAEPTSERASRVDLIRVISVARARERELDAMRLISERLERLYHRRAQPRDVNAQEPSVETPLDLHLARWQRALSHRAIEEALSADDVELSTHVPLRAQESLIYVTLERVFVSGDQLFLKTSIENRSQETFTLHRVTYQTPLMSRAQVVWPTLDQFDLDVSAASPDGAASESIASAGTADTATSRPRRVLDPWTARAGEGAARRVVRAPREALRGHVTFEGEGGRAVTLDLSGLSELSGGSE